MSSIQDSPAADAWIARLLGEPVLFDTMIVRHLCEAGAGDALAAAFAGRFRWGPAVQAELTLQARGRPALASFMATAPAVVLELTSDEDKEVEDIRLDMYGRHAVRRSDTEHLGEAQILYLAARDRMPVATNDIKARQRARADRVDAFHVCHVLLAMVRLGACRPGRAWEFYDRACVGGLFELAEYVRPGSRGRFIEEGSNLRALLLRERPASAR